MNTYYIIDENMERFTKKINAIQKKATKYGNPFVYKNLGVEYIEKEIYNEETECIEKATFKFNKIELYGLARIADWEMVARIEHTNAGNVFKKISDREIPVIYRNCNPYCEHCNAKRTRKDTYLVWNESEGFKQVGKSCLMDYTKGWNAEYIAQYLNLKEYMVECEAPLTTAMCPKSYVSMKEVMAITSEIVKINGWTSKANAEKYRIESTVMQMWEMHRYIHNGYKTDMFSNKKLINKLIDNGFDIESNEAQERAEKIIAFLKDIKVTNDYTGNLKVIANSENDMLEKRQVAIFISGILAYNREQERIVKERERKEKEKLSNHIGTIGKRLTTEVAECKLLTSWETMYGYTYMYQFKDTDGNILVWKATKWIENLESVKSITGTVKEHSEYNGCNQTIITRCRIKC